MPIVTSGDLAHSFQMRVQQGNLKRELDITAEQLASGRYSDLAKQTRGDLTPIAGIEHSLARLEGYKTATSEAELFSQALQESLGVVQDVGQTLSEPLIVASFSAGAASIQSVSTDARQKFETMVSSLNTQVGGRSVMAGAAIDRPALAEPEVIIAELLTAAAGAGGAADVKNAVDAWFAPGGGFETSGYLGSSENLAAYQIGQHRQATLDVSALDDRILGSLKGAAMAALLDEGVLDGNPSEQVALLRMAGEELLTTQAELSALRGEVGAFQATVEDAAQANDTEQYALQMARNGIVEVDPYEQATKLESARTQLESLYHITARLSRLSLVEFLR